MTNPIDRMEIERRSRALMETPTLHKIAEKARHAINNALPGREVRELRYFLARSYTEGYAAGWKRRGETNGEVMPMPDQR